MNKGDYAEAEKLFNANLVASEKSKPGSANVARSLAVLGRFYVARGKYAIAEPLLQRSVSITEKELGPDDSRIEPFLSILGSLYHIQGRNAEAEALYVRALTISEKAFGHDDKNLAPALNNLATVYADEGKFAPAETLHKRALAIVEKAFGPDSEYLSGSLNNLAYLYANENKYAEAEPLFKRALEIDEKSPGAKQTDLAIDLNNLAEFYKRQGKYAEAEPLYKRALALKEKLLGPEHPDVATSANGLAVLYELEGKYAEAEPLYKRAIAIREKAPLDPTHMDVANCLDSYASLLRKTGRLAEARDVQARAIAIFRGPNTPTMAFFANGQRAPQMLLTKQTETELAPHQVIKVEPDQSALDKPLNGEAFRELINMTVPDDKRMAWGKGLCQMEGEAAAQLCTRVKDMKNTEVVKLIGPPAFKSGSALCHRAAPDEDNWLYFFGGTPYLVRLNFQHGICRVATNIRYDMDLLYNWWRADELQSFAVGKTVDQIIAHEGPPADRSNKTGLPYRAKKWDRQISDQFDHSDEILTYHFGKSIDLMKGASRHSPNRWLMIKDGKCIFACDSMGGISVRFGSGPDLIEGATFRMPLPAEGSIVINRTPRSSRSSPDTVPMKTLTPADFKSALKIYFLTDELLSSMITYWGAPSDLGVQHHSYKKSASEDLAALTSKVDNDIELLEQISAKSPAYSDQINHVIELCKTQLFKFKTLNEAVASHSWGQVTSNKVSAWGELKSYLDTLKGALTAGGATGNVEAGYDLARKSASFDFLLQKTIADHYWAADYAETNDGEPSGHADYISDLGDLKKMAASSSDMQKNTEKVLAAYGVWRAEMRNIHGGGSENTLMRDRSGIVEMPLRVPGPELIHPVVGVRAQDDQPLQKLEKSAEAFEDARAQFRKKIIEMP